MNKQSTNILSDELHIYSRVSTVEQKENGTSLDTQKELVIKLSENVTNGKFKLWDEGSKSSFNDELEYRPILLNLLTEISRGHIKHLYVSNTDRLSRNQKIWGTIRHRLLQNNVLLYVGSDPNPIDLSDPMDNLLFGILSEISHYDNLIRMERFRLGKIERVKTNHWFGGPPPYGYRIEDRKIQIEPNEMKWVKFLFESYLNGMTFDQIRQQLWINGVKSRRGNLNWSNGTIVNIFNNTHFEGYYDFTDKKSNQTFRSNCPTEIPITLIHKVRKLHRDRSYRRGKGKIITPTKIKEYLLKGLLECGYCGSRFGGRTVKSQYIEHYYCQRNERNYQTKNTSKYKECKKGRRTLRISVCDDVIWNKVIDICENSFLFKEKNKIEILEKSNFDLGQKEIKKLELRINSYDRELKNIEKNIIKLESDKILKKRPKTEIDGILEHIKSHQLEINDKKENVINQIETNKKDMKWIDWVEEFSDKIKTIRNEKDLNIRKKFLNGLVDRIIVNYIDKNTHTLRVFFKIPYINDRLIWKNEKNKKLGYEIKKGLKSVYINYDEKKLYVDKRQKKTLNSK